MSNVSEDKYTINSVVGWITLVNYDDTKEFKQHAFILRKRTDSKDKNISLCGKIIIGNDDGKSAIFKTIIDRFENVNKDKACKHCLKKYNKKHYHLKKLES